MNAHLGRGSVNREISSSRTSDRQCQRSQRAAHGPENDIAASAGPVLDDEWLPQRGTTRYQIRKLSAGKFHSITSSAVAGSVPIAHLGTRPRARNTVTTF
jgi:hypothetical protein